MNEHECSIFKGETMETDAEIKTSNIMAACDRACERMAVHSDGECQQLPAFVRHALRAICDLSHPPDRVAALQQAHLVLCWVLRGAGGKAVSAILAPLGEAIRMAQGGDDAF